MNVGSSNLMLMEDFPTLLRSGCTPEEGLRLPEVSLVNGVQGEHEAGAQTALSEPSGAQHSQNH